jgi:multiple sugar transport system substrate-binding protein
MDSPETIRALQFYTDIYHKYKVAPAVSDINAWAGGNSEFANGTAAMLIFGRWPQADFLLNPEIDLGVTSPPRDKVRANILFWNGCGVSSSSDHKQVSAEFLTFYTGEGGAKIWQEGHLPALKSSVDQSSLLMNLIDHVWLTELNHLVPRAFASTPYWEETARTPLRGALTVAVMDPEADIARLLKDAAQQAQIDLDSYSQK